MRISDWSSDVCSSDLNPAWSDAFARLQERGRVVFSAAIDGQVYAKHGTTIDTRLTVIDRVPAADPNAFPVSPGVAPDTATLLPWVPEIGRAACKERVCQYVSLWVVAGPLNTKQN